jgi:hypothetical protein
MLSRKRPGRISLGGVDESHIKADSSASVPWNDDTVDRSVELSGVLGTGLEVFDGRVGDDCDESG